MRGMVAFALAHRLFMILVALVLVGAGTIALKNIPIDAFPDVSPTQVKIITKMPGMTPEEIETRITAPVEVELLGIPKLTMLRSIAKYALTDITLDFEEGTDIYWAKQQVAERLSGIWEDLPDGVSGGIAPMTTPLGEMFMFTIEGGGLSLMQRRNLLDWVIRPALRTVHGVADVNALGGLVRSFDVTPDNALLTARGIKLEDLEQALRRNNRNDGAGRLTEGEEALLVRVEGRIKTLQDVSTIVVSDKSSVPVTIGDIATVRIGAITRYGAVSRDGKGETVEGLVLGLRGANARRTVAGVRAKLEELRPSLPDGVEINVFYDRGHLVNRATGTVVQALAEAVVLVLILLGLFLGNFRAALSVALILPLSALFTFILMYWLGLSANLMSLGGLAIAIGMLVDAAVVVVENVTNRLSETNSKRHLPTLHVIYRAVTEVSVPVTSGILIIIIVFTPLLTLQGLEGKLFAPVALTIVFALSGSLLLSLTVIPVLASFLIKQVSQQEPWLPRKLHAAYPPVLSWCLARKKLILIITSVSLMLTMLAYTQIGRAFIPTMDEGDIVVQLEKLPSISLAQSVELDLLVQRSVLAEVPEVHSIIARVGSDEIGLDPMSLNETDAFFVLKHKEKWGANNKEDLIDKIRTVLDQFPGIAYSFTQPIQMRVSEMLTGVRGDVAVKIFGPNLEVLNQTAQQLVVVLSEIPGAVDAFTSQNEGVQYLQVIIDYRAAGLMGIEGDELERILRTQVEGVPVGIVQEGIQRTPLILRGNTGAADFANLQLTLTNGRRIALSSIASLQREEGVVSVARERGQRFVVVRCNVEDRDLVGFVDEALERVNEQIKLPPAYTIEWGGQFENQQRAAARLSIVIPLSIGLIFLLLFWTFGSVRQALLVLTNIPLALIGGVFALWLSGEYLSVPASVGFIALLGIAVLNGVVMVSYFNQLLAAGMPMDRVIVEGAVRRLRPVMMTASIAAIGLAPLLIATGPGSEIQRPLAIVVIGGLVTSTLLTLIVLPILYPAFSKFRETS